MTPRSSIAAKPDEEVYELSTADSIAPRVYVRFVLCFPFDEALASKAEAVRSLQHALDSAVASWPHLSGQLQVVKSDGPGRGRMVLRCASAAGGRSRYVTPASFPWLREIGPIFREPCIDALDATVAESL